MTHDKLDSMGDSESTQGSGNYSRTRLKSIIHPSSIFGYNTHENTLHIVVKDFLRIRIKIETKANFKISS